MVTFSERLGQLIEEYDVTLEELANAVGSTKSTISRYKNSKREPKTYLVKKIANYFNVSVDYLLGNTDERSPAHKIKEEFEATDAEIQELMERFNVHLDGEILTAEDKKSVIDFLRMLRDRDKKKGNE